MCGCYLVCGYTFRVGLCVHSNSVLLYGVFVCVYAFICVVVCVYIHIVLMLCVVLMILMLSGSRMVLSMSCI